MKIIIHGTLILFLTLISQLGGLAWLLALLFKHRVISFVGIYALLSLNAIWIAPMMGRTALPCFGSGQLQMHSKAYCLLNRYYVTPELESVLQDFSQVMEKEHPKTYTRILDANFPFFTGFPLLPHLSHHDGRKVDIAFYYKDKKGYLPRATRSPIGYFAFEQGPSRCEKKLLSLRWDLAWLQPLWADLDLDAPRMRTALKHLSSEPRLSKIFIEPHLLKTLNFQSLKIRFQGCRAARHDDHIHIQL